MVLETLDVRGDGPVLFADIAATHEPPGTPSSSATW